MGHILVTGANGFIGSHLVRSLLQLKNTEPWKDKEIVCLVRPTSDLSSIKNLDIKLVTGDLREPKTLQQVVKGAEYIFHLGAEVYTVTRQMFIDSIARGTENLLQAVLEHGGGELKRFLHVSSQAAAGPADKNEPIDETRPFRQPISWYAEAKQEAEKICQAYMKKNIPITIVRPPSVYGERDLGMEQVYKAVKVRIHARTGFKTRYTGMVYVQDLVEGILAAAADKKGNTRGEIFFLANMNQERENLNYTVRDVSKAIATAINKPFGIPIPIPIFIFYLIAFFTQLLHLFFRGRPVPTIDKIRDLSQVYWLCSSQKAKNYFDWQAHHSLVEGFKKTCQFYEEQERQLRLMPLEPKGLLWLKFVIVSMLLGAILEICATVGKFYVFTPGWLIWPVIPLFWGLVAGSIIMWTRTCNLLIRFLPGFILLFGLEMLNHHYLHNWFFPDNALFGVTSPIGRALITGIVAGIFMLLVCAIVKSFYKRKLRLG